METETEDQTSPDLIYGQFGGKEHADTVASYITRDEVIKEQRARINKLPPRKRWPFEVADNFIPIYGGLTGVICNSYLRRMFMIRRGLFVTGIPMFVLPAATTKIGWLGFVTMPILAGDLQCSLCGEMRGALVNVGLAVLYPFVVGLPLTCVQANSQRTMEIPKLKLAVTNWPKFAQFWTRKLRYFKFQFITLAIFHGVLGSFIAKKQMDVCANELKIKFAKVQVPDKYQ